MKLVVDTNVIFSALIAGGKTREAILMDDIDPDDVPFLALALYCDAAVWSDNEHFQKQDAVTVWQTSALLDQLGLV